MSSDIQPAAASFNLPIPVLNTFSVDELSLIFGTCLVDATFVLDVETGHLLAGNHKLLELLGVGLADVDCVEVPFTQYVHPEDRWTFRTWLRRDLAGRHVSFEARLVGGDGRVVPVEVVGRPILWRGKEYGLGFLRPCAERHSRENKLRTQVELQKERALQALKSSLRVYELSEKIKSTLELTTTLLNVESEEQLYSESVKVLTRDEGLNFRDVTFLVMDGGQLSVAISTLERSPATFSLSEDNKYTRAMRRGFAREAAPSGNREFLVPLRSRETLLGIIEVFQHAREIAFFAEYPLIAEWQRDMLYQIGDVVALLLDNLRLKREFKKQSIIDPLTGVYNRNFFMSRLDMEVRRAVRYRRPVSLVFIDVDRFKQINDQYGHLQGDSVLAELGQLFRSTLRELDLICRYGGDEFVVLLPEVNPEMARKTAEKICSAVRGHRFPCIDAPTQSLQVTVSLGTSTLAQNQSPEQFLSVADAALYRSKSAGRDQLAPPPPDGAPAA